MAGLGVYSRAQEAQHPDGPRTTIQVELHLEILSRDTGRGGNSIEAALDRATDGVSALALITGKNKQALLFIPKARQCNADVGDSSVQLDSWVNCLGVSGF
jgi:hypothetical protein